MLFNRYVDRQWNASELGIFVGLIGEMMATAATITAEYMPDALVWLSTDHFATPPPLSRGDVMHTGLYPMLDAMWPSLANTSYDWAIAVHPYDNGDPRSNLSSQGVYTFATLDEMVASYQCSKLGQYAGVPPSQCNQHVQTLMYASEQG